MTRIVADTTCGLDMDLARQLNIPMISQIINFDEESFREGVDIDHATFMSRLLAGRALPKTAAPYPGDFIEAFTELTRGGEAVMTIEIDGSFGPELNEKIKVLPNIFSSTMLQPI